MEMRIVVAVRSVVRYAMPTHRWFLLALLVSGGCATRAPLARAPGETDDYLTLPTDWSVGSRHRYRATWKREFGLPSSPNARLDQSLNGEIAGEVAVSVVEKTAAGYVLRWEPTLAPAPAPRIAAGDMATAAAALWRYELTLPLELTLDLQDPSAPLGLRNVAAVQSQMMGEFQRLAKDLGLGIDCRGPDAGSYACKALGSAEGASGFASQHVGPLFNCAGLELDTREPMAWTQAHPNPAIGDTVPIDYRREAVAFDPRSPEVRALTVWQPNPEKWSAWIKRELAKIAGATPQLKEQLGRMAFRMETDCTMNRLTGWPALIEQRTTVGADAFAGSQTTRFERLEH
jgi:hypothetical protein